MDQQRNEFTLVKKIIIGLIIINLMTTFFALTTGNSLGVNCTTASADPNCQLQNVQNGVAASLNSTTNSFACLNQNGIQVSNGTSISLSSVNKCWFKPPAITNSTSVCFLSGCPFNVISAAVVYAANFLSGIVTFVVNGAILFGYFAYMVLFIIIYFIPALFATLNLGIFTTIFITIYGLTLFIGVAYLIYIVLNRTPYVH